MSGASVGLPGPVNGTGGSLRVAEGGEGGQWMVPSGVIRQLREGPSGTPGRRNGS